MKVEEARALVETVLEDERLNNVQELIFRQCWEGRHSYQEIAQVAGYDYEYIKATGAKLWKLLTEAFGEKVKKSNLQSVLKRYLRRHHITLQQNKGTGFNLSGSNLSGARLFFANIKESDSCQANFYKDKRQDDKTELEQEKIKAEPAVNPNANSPAEKLTHIWNGWQFHSAGEVSIAEALNRAGVLFFPKATARLTTPDGKQNQDLHFLICYEGKLGILAVDLAEEDQETATDGILQSQGIRIIQHYDVNECTVEPQRVVLEFLQLLSQA
ncbi:hypothetical protein NG798_04235 [Ancylothrix sp. C2]|uniref:hypothetical protein n=1 Tax=Ancylothrix sp. D3o TaxID=2953691 RepID=UPI0021BB1543|nr:hypothetical protein [Ancylothrix sp. D3o]MCT7948987.1 hypothetical protein [Ancylothrix sp. D3o]